MTSCCPDHPLELKRLPGDGQNKLFFEGSPLTLTYSVDQKALTGRGDGRFSTVLKVSLFQTSESFVDEH